MSMPIDDVDCQTTDDQPGPGVNRYLLTITAEAEVIKAAPEVEDEVE